MKKKVFLGLFVSLALVTIVGCESINKKSLTIKERIGKSYEYYATIKCAYLDDGIVDLSYDGFVTKNKAYELSVDKIYSNETNCKEVPINDLDGDIINGSGGAYVYTKKYQYGVGKRVQKEIYDNRNYALLSTLGNDIIYGTCGINGGYEIASIDNEIKMIKIASTEENSRIKRIIDVDDNFSLDEEVLTISGPFIKTNKAYYKVKRYIENKDECKKYADVSCKYGYKINKDKELTDNYNDILFAGIYIIDKDYNVYKVK